MDCTEIIEQDEVIETAAGFCNGLKTVGGIAVVSGIAYAMYRYVVKPMRQKAKEKAVVLKLKDDGNRNDKELVEVED